MTLNETQIKTLLKLFPMNCNGAESIARKLLTKGKCIVAGTEPIWRGGVGNFIKTKDAEDGVDCLEYTMDVETFISSNMVQDHLDTVLGLSRRELQEKQNAVMCIIELIRK